MPSLRLPQQRTRQSTADWTVYGTLASHNFLTDCSLILKMDDLRSGELSKTGKSMDQG